MEAKMTFNCVITMHCVITLLTSVIVCLDMPTSMRSVHVETKHGILIGRLEQYMYKGTNRTTTALLGIPYAHAPLNTRRFMPPQLYDSWVNLTDAYHAVRMKPLCSYTDHTGTMHGSEDCLYLNIYVPMSLAQVQHLYTLQLPVMVYFPDASQHIEDVAMADPILLALQGNQIVVTVSYRTAILGFFADPEQQVTGNAGILDQQMALHWIWDNISDLGGDPQQIMLHGAGLGATSIIIHAMSPKANVFNKVILHNPMLEAAQCIQHNTEGHARAIYQLLSCKHGDIACLQKQPIRELLTSGRSLEEQMGAWLPVIDGSVVKEFINIEGLLEHIRPIDLVIGYSTRAAWDHISNQPYPLADGTVLTSLDKALTYLSDNYAKDAQTVYRLLSNEYAACTSAFDTTDALLRLLTDALYMYPVTKLAQMVSSRGSSVYVYRLYDDSYYSDDLRPALSPSSNNRQIDAGGANIGDIVRTAWCNFMHKGDPNSLLADGGVTWREFDLSHRSYLDLAIPLDSSREGMNLGGRGGVLWVDYLPQVLATSACQQYHSYCGTEIESTGSQRKHASSTAAILAGLLVIMCVVCIVLGLSHITTRHRMKLLFCSCCMSTSQQNATAHRHHAKRHKQSAAEAERKKLHPLPYCDET